MANYLEKLHHIKCFVFDVDGVLTDGKVLALASGEQARSFLVKDGYAIECALQAGYQIAIISGGAQEGVRKRLEFLKIQHIHLGVKDKTEVLNQLCTDTGIALSEILYMGDDWPDYDVMKTVGLPCSPADAIPEILAVSLYVSNQTGGAGCVRDVIEKVLRVQGKFKHTHNLSINN